ncbi:hypothetical protein NE865_04878 [Phthorimaea operculella]|nr:hypothetical protein NE865_04878 [Phthorimaea operculella]
MEGHAEGSRKVISTGGYTGSTIVVLRPPNKSLMRLHRSCANKTRGSADEHKKRRLRLRRLLLVKSRSIKASPSPRRAVRVLVALVVGTREETRPREQPGAAGVNPGTVSPGRGAEVQKQKGSKRPDKKERDRLAKKRARTNETISPSGDQKKQKVDKSQTQPRQSYSEATKQDFAVAITKVNGILTQESADLILKDIMLKMISEGRVSTADDNGPVFRAKPSYAEGYLRLWGDDQKTVDWLRNTVSAMTLPSGEKLTVKTQAEIPKRTRVGILIPDPMDVWKEVKDIGHVLAWQNKWAQCERWLVQKAMKQEVGWFLVVSVPNDLVPTLVAKRRCLSCLLGAVYIRFQGPGGKFYETPPDRTQGTEGLKITGVQMPKTSSPKQGSSAMSVADEEPEATNSDMDAAQKPPEEETLKAFEDLLLDSDGEGIAPKDGVPFV